MRTVPAAHLIWPLIDQEDPRAVAVWTMAQMPGARAWSVKELAGELPIPDAALSETLESLVASRQIRRVGVGRYRLQATDDELQAVA